MVPLTPDMRHVKAIIMLKLFGTSTLRGAAPPGGRNQSEKPQNLSSQLTDGSAKTQSGNGENPTLVVLQPLKSGSSMRVGA